MNDARRGHDGLGGFTLVELLVVIGIITVLIGVLLPVLGEARASASQVRATSDVRQLLVAHQFYRLDHDGSVPLAYLPDKLHGETPDVEVDGNAVGFVVARRYPWRLIGYVEDVWDVVFSGQPAIDPRGSIYDASINPSFGINAVFVGGDADFRHRGFVDRSRPTVPFSSPAKYLPAGAQPFMVPNAGRHVVFKEAEVREPSTLILFADAKLRGGPMSSGSGYCNVNAPVSNGRLWTTEPDPDTGRERVRVVDATRAIGIPEGRYGKGAAVGFFDGHAESLFPDELDDMRLWANWADAPDDDFVP